MSISREEMVLLIDQCKATDTPIKQNPSDNSEGVVNNFIATFIKWSGLFFENEPIVKISQSKDGRGRLTSEIRETQSLSPFLSLPLSGPRHYFSDFWNFIDSAFTLSLPRSKSQFSQQVIAHFFVGCLWGFGVTSRQHNLCNCPGSHHLSASQCLKTVGRL